MLSKAASRLRAAGVDSPRREARLLLASVLGIAQEDIVAENVPHLTPTMLARFDSVLERRAQREPLAYITGSREFWSLDFAVGPGVLVPRPDSEILVEEALRRFPDREAPLRVLDLGTGSGCLLLAFLWERPQAEGLGVDSSEQALGIAARNAKALGLDGRARFARGHWTKTLSGLFDAILVNPPYIAKDELEALQPEVARYEPRAALDGGEDGLEAYRQAAAGLASHLSLKGRAFFELGQGQAEAVAAILAQNGLTIEGTVCDLASIPRCLVAGAGPENHAKKRIGIGDTKRLGSAPLGTTKGSGRRTMEEPEEALVQEAPPDVTESSE
jgi:release factor glutamine methyltransferase